MKLFGPLFWAVMLIAAGVLLLLNHLFSWNIKVFGVLIGVFFVLLGVSFITGPRLISHGEGTFFMSGKVSPDDKEVNCVFSSATVDVQEYDKDDLEVNSIFSGVVIETGGRAIKIKGTSVFGSVKMPDGGTIAFGDRTYESEGTGKQLELEVSCVFGSVIIR